LKELKWDRSIF